MKPQINPDAVRLMKQEDGIDMEKEQYPKLLEDIPEADIYVSMGCNVACPNIPGKKVINWGLDDPTGKEDEEFMDVIRQIEKKILEMEEKYRSGRHQSTAGSGGEYHDPAVSVS